MRETEEAKCLESFSLVADRTEVPLTRRGNLVTRLVCRDCLGYLTQNEVVQEVNGNLCIKMK